MFHAGNEELTAPSVLRALRVNSGVFTVFKNQLFGELFQKRFTDGICHLRGYRQETHAHPIHYDFEHALYSLALLVTTGCTMPQLSLVC